MAVAFFHFPILGALKAFPLFSHAYLFVDFFFVLSGFVIASTWEGRLRSTGDVWTFLIRRFGRIWPLHAAVLALFVAVAVLQGDIGTDERHSVGAIFTNLALIHGLGVHRDLTWNGPSWSISVEALLYLMFAFLAPLPRRGMAYVALVILGLGVLAFRSPHGMASTFDYGAYRGFAGFFTGALLTRLPLRDFGSAGEIAATVIALAFVAFNRGTILAPAVFGLVVYVFAGSRGMVSKALTWTPFHKLGEWSYSVYMLHALAVAAIWAFAPHLGFVRHGAHFIAPTAWMMWAVAAIYVVSIIGASAVSYRLVEEPARRMFNSLTRQRTALAE